MRGRESSGPPGPTAEKAATGAGFRGGAAIEVGIEIGFLGLTGARWQLVTSGQGSLFMGILFAQTVPIAGAIIITAQYVAQAILQVSQILRGLPLVIIARGALVEHCTRRRSGHLAIGGAIIVLRQQWCEGLTGIPASAVLMIAIPIQLAMSVAGLSAQRLHLGCRLHIAIALRHFGF